MADINNDLTYHGKPREKQVLPTVPRRVHENPRDPAKIKKIIRLRHRGLSWQQIADEIGTTRMAPRLLYFRWIDWSKKLG